MRASQVSFCTQTEQEPPPTGRVTQPSAPTAVSYTHLDVYKRQLYTFPVCGVLGFFLTKFLIRL